MTESTAETGTGGLSLRGPLTDLPGVGPVRAARLRDAGFQRIRDLLLHLPSRYEDRRHTATVASLTTPGPVTLGGRVLSPRAVRLRRRGLSMVRARLQDASGHLPVIWFNRPYLTDWLREDRDYVLHGELRRGRDGNLELLNPSVEPAGEVRHAARIVPIYPAAGGIGPARWRRWIALVLERADLDSGLREDLPVDLLARYALPPLPVALRRLHAPPDDAVVEDLNAGRTAFHQRLIYGELLILQLELALLRAQDVRSIKPHRYRVDARTREAARRALPFRLTGAQKRVLREIVDDLRSPHPMLRLLQGDVGSGKTIVAALALVVAMESGLQGAFLAPTELLAEQHFRTLCGLLGERYRTVLFTRSAAGRRAAVADLRAGRAQLAVGTHALLEDTVDFTRLGLAVVDEQHRFGVAQRRRLQAKGQLPDMLVMTATPIPRSLALTLYGDLEVSILDELPPGRLPIRTDLVPAGGRTAVYEELRRELATGAQAYVVFPLIDESDNVAAESIEAEGARVAQRLAGVRCAILHGRMAAEEREEVMAAFAAGRLQVLIATTVIEVGVDVPNATWMVIESAERFGLAQLHQLRGRVGRGRRASRCVALHGALGERARERLAVFAATQDGFRIAEADLDIRGPGELLGTRQAGIPVFRAAHLVRDQAWLQRARGDARELMERQDEPALQPLFDRLRQRLTNRYERFAGA